MPADPPPDPPPAEGAALELGEVRTRAVRATGGLLGRQVVVRGLDALGLLVLAPLLSPAVFGVFAIARFVVIFFKRLGDVGLSATLIRKPGAVTEAELRTVFTIQQAVVAVSVVLIWVGAPLVTAHYAELGPEHVWLVRALGASLLLSSLRTIPSVLVQRQLRHERLAVVDIVEVVVYNALTIGLVLAGLEVWALVWGFLARGLVGMVLTNALAWWRPRFGFSRAAAREVAGFGVPIQLGSLLTLARDAVVPVFVGSVLGAAAVGLVNLARTLLNAAVEQPLSLMGRVQLRVFGHVQRERARLERALERTVFLGGALVGLPLALVVALAEPLMRHVIGTEWLPALPVVALVGAAFATNVVSNPLVQAVKAVGEGWTLFRSQAINVGVLATVFALTYRSLGLAAFGWGFLAAQAAVGVYAGWRLRPYARPAWGRAALPALVACLAAGGVAWAVSRAVASLPGMILAGAAAALVFALVLGALAGRRVASDLGLIVDAVGGRSERARAAGARVQRGFAWLDRTPEARSRPGVS